MGGIELHDKMQLKDKNQEMSPVIQKDVHQLFEVVSYILLDPSLYVAHISFNKSGASDHLIQLDVPI